MIFNKSRELKIRKISKIYRAIIICELFKCSRAFDMFLFIVALFAVFQSSKAQCVYDGVTRQEGDKYNSTDGCNTCLCSGKQTYCTEMACAPATAKCIYNNVVQSPGDNFPSVDGCNTCMCGNDGVVACTELFCLPHTTPGPLAGCQYNGNHYIEGDSFQSIDGCNTCYCTNGLVGCTLRWCPQVSTPATPCVYHGRHYESGATFKSDDGCNDCTCKGGAVTCSRYPCPMMVDKDPKHCVVNGIVYNVGDSYPAPDSCNACYCQGHNISSCTEEFCLVGRSLASTGATCEFHGKTYNAGENFRTPDGCTACGCTASGVVCSNLFLCLKPVHISQKREVTTTTQSSVNEVGGCHYNGQVFWAGQSWDATDGCNRCYCSAHGGSLCSDKPCAQKDDVMTTTTTKPTTTMTTPTTTMTTPTTSATNTDCEYHGKTYPFRASWPDIDGCNRCFCAQWNFVECSLLWHCTFGTQTVGKR